jgi:hypothetical protein
VVRNDPEDPNYNDTNVEAPNTEMERLEREVERLSKFRPLAVEALNELRELRKQIVHGGAWTKKIDDLFERARKAGL